MECSSKLGLALYSITSHLSHEINQPLGAIANYASSISRRLVTSDAQASELIGAAEAIRAEVKRAADVVAKMRSGIGNLHGAVEVVDFRLIVRAAVDQIEARLRARHSVQIRLEAAYPEAAAMVRGSPAALTYALFNLLTNSVESLDPPWTGPRVISIRMQLEDGLIDLTIVDTGPGLRHDIKTSLFTPFTTSKPGHFGLGLAITRDILNEHGGSIMSVPQSEGSSFNVLLPTLDGAFS